MAVSDLLATAALRHREQLYLRTRKILNTNYPVLKSWLESFGSLFSWTTPECGAICFVRYNLNISSTVLVESIRREQNVLLVPGDHFQTPRFLRFGYGNEPDELEAALDRVARGLRDRLGD